LGLFDFISSDIGIDLGTANTLVFVRGQGIVPNEPSVVAVEKATNKVLAVGSAAKEMLGRTPGEIAAIRPLKDGVIADFEISEKMLSNFIRRVIRRRYLMKPRILISVPSGITEVEKRAVRDSAENAGAREVFLLQEPMAAAIGVGLPVDQPSGIMVIDVGGGTSEIAVIALNGIVNNISIRIAGDEMSGGSALSPAVIAVILDVIFPLGMFLYCREVLSRRPFSSPGHLPLSLRDLSVLFAVASITVVLGVTVATWLLEDTPVTSLLVLLFASSVIAIALLLPGRMVKGTMPQGSREDVSEGLESLGDFLLAGEPLEAALLKTAERREGTELAGSISRDIFLVSRGTTRAGETLTCEGAIQENPVLGSNLMAVVDIAQKDGTLAGTVAKRIASDLKETSRTEADARDEMGPIVQTVNSTLTFFSPLVLGVTAAMFLLMEAHFSGSEGTTSSAFVLILGALLCCNLAVASYFTEGLQGGDLTTALSRIGKGLLMAIPLYSLSFLCASYFFGVL